MKRKILSLLLAVILFCLPVFYACGEKEKEKPDGEIDFKVRFYDIGDSGYYYYQLVETPLIINSTEEWDTVKDIRNYMDEEEKQDYERLLSISGAYEALPGDIKEKYNKKFFKKNSLIIFTFLKGNAGDALYEAEILNIYKHDSELTAEILLHSGIAECIVFGIIIVEVEKTDISGIDDVQIIWK